MTPTLIDTEPDYRHSFNLLVGTISDPELHSSCEFLFEDERFFTWPGSLSKHHAYEGGLIQHTIEVARIAMHMTEAIPGVKHDVLVTAALWHDWGKVLEYEPDGEWYKRASDPRAHIQWSAMQFARAIPTEPNEEVLHCILAHHGRPEWGSADEPKTAEAMILHQADMLSAFYGETAKRQPE